jgi:hypothetical protein
VFGPVTGGGYGIGYFVTPSALRLSVATRSDLNAGATDPGDAAAFATMFQKTIGIVSDFME